MANPSSDVVHVESWKKGAVHVLGVLGNRYAAIAAKQSDTPIVGEIMQAVHDSLREIRLDIERL